MKRDKIDSIFSLLIRERSEWNCEYSGLYFPEPDRISLHCAHIIGRKYLQTRHHPDNAIALAAKHHAYFTDHPADFGAWITKYMGEGRLQLMREKAHSNVKWTKADKEDLYQHLKKEYAIMIQKRKDGVRGRIDFEAFN